MIKDMQGLYEVYGEDIVSSVTRAYDLMGGGTLEYYGKVLTNYYMERRTIMTFVKNETGCSWDEIEEVMRDLEEATFKLNDKSKHVFEEAFNEFKETYAGHDDHGGTSDEEEQPADPDEQEDR